MPEQESMAVFGRKDEMMKNKVMKSVLPSLKIFPRDSIIYENGGEEVVISDNRQRRETHWVGFFIHQMKAIF